MRLRGDSSIYPMKTRAQRKEDEAKKASSTEETVDFDIVSKLSAAKPTDPPATATPMAPTADASHLALKSVLDPNTLSDPPESAPTPSRLDKPEKLADLLTKGVTSEPPPDSLPGPPQLHQLAIAGDPNAIQWEQACAAGTIGSGDTPTPAFVRQPAASEPPLTVALRTDPTHPDAPRTATSQPPPTPTPSVTPTPTGGSPSGGPEPQPAQPGRWPGMPGAYTSFSSQHS
jgi:hypothetical protein